MQRFLLFTIWLPVFVMTFAYSQPDPAAQPGAPVAVESAMRTLSFRLKPGQDLKDELDKLVKNGRIDAGTMLTCVGSLTDVMLRLANQESGTRYQGHFEIVSLVGTLSTAGSHLHLAVSDSTGRTLGGHLLAGCKIYTTAEIVIGVLTDLTFTRESDPAFGYKELVVRKKIRK